MINIDYKEDFTDLNKIFHREVNKIDYQFKTEFRCLKFFYFTRSKVKLTLFRARTHSQRKLQKTSSETSTIEI